MELIKILPNQTIAKKNDIVSNWYLVQSGSVTQKFDFSEITLGKNAIIGFLEKEIYMCDYVATEETVLAAFPCNNAEDLKKILSGQEKVRNIFLRAAIEQRHQLLILYSELHQRATQYHAFVESEFNNYKILCEHYKTEQKPFSKMEHFNPLKMLHKAENWEILNSLSLMKTYISEYIQLMEKDDGLTIGVIMEAAAQMRRFAMGIDEIEYYLTYNRDILINDAESDLFSLYFELSVEMFEKKYDIAEISDKVNKIYAFADKMKLYNPRTLQRRLREFVEYDYANDGSEKTLKARVEMDITTVDSISHILEYAGYKDAEIDEIHNIFTTFKNLPDRLSSDKQVYTLRKEIAKHFYDIYYKVFIRAMKEENTLTPVLEMFLNFGFMDISFVGEKYAKELYALCAHLDICRSENIFTIYEWLKCIYYGEKEPSKNEFDMDYQEYLIDLQKSGKLTPVQVKEFLENYDMRVKFEIQNMFTTNNKLTYGRLTTFTPVLSEDDIINSIEKMLVSAEKLDNALNKVRKIDYSAFYREVSFSDPRCGITSDRVMQEILPDIILMPNAGSKGMMWQEISGKKSNTPGRFMFPILTAVDLDDLMLETIGRFRWEMCRRLEGIHWNDVREKSLTAEYVTYLQFYRKNHDLSTEVKESIKNSLAREKNNYREVFVRDYINWIQFESRGSFRLNKVARDILARYCPFVKSIRSGLKENPLYQASITRFDADNAKNFQRYQGLYNKYVKAGGEQPEIKDTMQYYDM